MICVVQADCCDVKRCHFVVLLMCQLCPGLQIMFIIGHKIVSQSVSLVPGAMPQVADIVGGHLTWPHQTLLTLLTLATTKHSCLLG